jgi:hypothetical protein
MWWQFSERKTAIFVDTHRRPKKRGQSRKAEVLKDVTLILALIKEIVELLRDIKIF